MGKAIPPPLCLCETSYLTVLICFQLLSLYMLHLLYLKWFSCTSYTCIYDDDICIKLLAYLAVILMTEAETCSEDVIT